MNKTTSTLAGLALLAAASIAPALASGAFPPTTGGTFSSTPTSFSLLGVSPASFFDFSTGTLYSGTASVLGGTVEAANPDAYDGSTLLFTGSSVPGGTAFSFTDAGTAVLTFAPGVVTVSAGKGFKDSFAFTSPVPEASTVASFGVLLALGSLAVLRRKSVKNAA